MTTLSSLPDWPRYLDRAGAAAYVGVSVDTFDREVEQGMWPLPRHRGARGTKPTWDRHALDVAADRDSGLDQPSPELTGFNPWAGRSGNATTAR